MLQSGEQVQVADMWNLRAIAGMAPCVGEEPSPAVSPERKRELLLRVVAVLEEVAGEFGDQDAWKWACIGIRNDMLEDVEEGVTLPPFVVGDARSLSLVGSAPAPAVRVVRS